MAHYHLPVILLLGAKSTHRQLESVPAELSALNALLDQHKQADPAFVLGYEPYCTLALLKTELDKRAGKIAILHFAGHSNAEALVTDGEVVYAQHIADILSTWRSPPSLIFLNGCHNAAQVKLFHDAGVPVVIATRRAVDDRQAAGFAREFYASLFTEAGQVGLKVVFERAGSKVLLGENRQVRSLDIGEVDKTDADEWDWGLFAKHSEYAETWTIRRLLTEGRPILGADGKPINPYRGLEAFREEDRAFFFGRDELTAKLLDIIPKQRFFSLLGASGSGKSSLVSAGLIPRLREQTGEWLILSTRPSNDPFREFIKVFIEDFYVDERKKLEEIKDEFEHMNAHDELEEKLNKWRKEEPDKLRKDVEILGRRLHMALTRTKTKRVLLFIDQFEELFTQSSPEDAQAFQLQLSALVNTEKLPCTVLIAMRADFLAAALGYPELAKLLNQFPDEKLPPMDKADVRAAIVRPAQKQRVTVEPDLVEALLDDMQGQADGLPLLQLVLTKLWETGAADDNLITRQEYNKLGGLATTLQTHAEGVFTKLTGTEQAQCERLFLKLIRYGEEASTRRRAYVSDLTQSVPDAKSILAKLAASDARLISMKQTGQDEAAYAEIAHEALIRHWNRLGGAGGWIEKHKKDLLIENELAPLAGKWVATNSDDPAKRDAAYLLTGSRLSVAEEWLARNTASTVSQVAVFIQTSIDERSRQEELERQRAAELRRRQLETNYNLAKVFEEKALSALNFGQNKRDTIALQKAWLYALEAQKLPVVKGYMPLDAKTVTSLASIDAVILSPERKRTPSFNLGSSVKALAYSPDGNVIAIGFGNKTIRLWDARSGEELSFLDHVDVEYSIDKKWTLTYRPDGKVLAFANGEKILFWDVETGTKLRMIENESAVGGVLEYSPDGKLVAATYSNNAVRLWDAQNGKELKTLVGNSDRILSVAFSPNGKILASGYSDKIIRLWSVQTGAELSTLKGHDGEISALCYSPDGKLLVSASADTSIRLWDAYTGVLLTVFNGHKDVITRLAYSPEGRIVATASRDETVRLWDVTTGVEFRVFRGHSDSVNALAYSPCGRILASGSEDRTVRFWSLHSCQRWEELENHSDAVNAVVYSPDGKIIASASWDNTIRVWDAQKGEELCVLRGHRGSVIALAYSPDGKLIASGSGDATVRVWNAQTGKEINTFACQGIAIILVTFSLDGETLMAVSRKSILLWDVKNGILSHSFITNNEGVIQAAAFSPYKKIVATGDRNKVVCLWEVALGYELISFLGHRAPIMTLAFSPDGETLASGSGDKAVQLWNVQTGAHVRTFSGHDNAVSALAYSPDGTVLASGSYDKTIRLWDVDNGTVLNTLIGHDDVLHSLAYSPDGKILASASCDTTVRLWDIVGKHKILKNAKIATCVLAYSPDGKVLASGSQSGDIELWDTEKGHKLHTLIGHKEGVYALAYSPDGKVLASGSEDKTVRLWDACTGTELRILGYHSKRGVGVVIKSIGSAVHKVENEIYGLLYSPDSRMLASCSQGRIIIWDISTGKEVDMLMGFDGLTYNPDNRTVAINNKDKVCIVDMLSQKLIGVINKLEGSFNNVKSER